MQQIEWGTAPVRLLLGFPIELHCPWTLDFDTRLGRQLGHQSRGKTEPPGTSRISGVPEAFKFFGVYPCVRGGHTTDSLTHPSPFPVGWGLTLGGRQRFGVHPCGCVWGQLLGVCAGRPCSRTRPLGGGVVVGRAVWERTAPMG